ncbi:MAG TPA: hypothetical protein VGV15_24025 [Terriglobales bacterium]|nr:hypothetical protein [Terriglobales bacterium]
MSRARRVLIFGGIALAAFGMLYGLYYAVFVEHQTLDQMGGSLAAAFVYAAERNTAESHLALDAYASTKYDYVRQVDVHSHWIGLAMLMIVLGAAFDRLAFGQRIQLAIAWGLLAGCALFPLGVILQTVGHGSAFASAMAILGSGLVVIALAVTAFGFVRDRTASY